MNEYCGKNTRVCICVCTLGRDDNLTALLRALAHIELDGYNPAGIELLVIDNKPSAIARGICDGAIARLPFGLEYIEEPRCGVTYARNRAVAESLARGAEFVAFVDDDDIPRPDWLVQLLNRQVESGADLVFGTWVLGREVPDWIRDQGVFRNPGRERDKFKRKSKYHRYGLPASASTCNLLASRRILERVAADGPVFSHDFRHSGGEDKDFFLRARAMGARFASAECSVIYRNHAPERFSSRELLRRGFKNGCSRVNLARAHAGLLRRLALAGSALVKLLLILLTMPFSVGSRSHFNHHLYRMGKSCGVLYASYTGRSIHYYAR